MVTVRCPKCGEVVRTTTPVGSETMVYCLRCRRWCRELDENPTPAALKVRKGIRCH